MYNGEDKRAFEEAIRKFIAKMDEDIITINISCKKSVNSIQYTIHRDNREKCKIEDKVI